MTQRKVIYIVSEIDKALAFEWVAEHLDSSKYDLCFILLNEKEGHLERFLNSRNRTWRIWHPGKIGLFRSIWAVMKILWHERPYAIHCHLRKANIVGLTAGFLTRIPMRIYTRHSSTFNWVFFPKSVKYDRLMNWMATDIVAISHTVRDVVCVDEKVPESKVHLIRHGFDLESFQEVDPASVSAVRERWKIPSESTIIGVISRFIEWKGIQFIIPAFRALIDSGLDATLLLANASGPYAGRVQEMLRELPDQRYRVIPFEDDVQALYKCFDCFVHVPVDPRIEAFGQTYVEALASGVPSVFTLSGVAHEVVQDGKNALVVPYEDPESITEALIRLVEDDELRRTLALNGRESIREFTLHRFVGELEDLYAN